MSSSCETCNGLGYSEETRHVCQDCDGRGMALVDGPDPIVELVQARAVNARLEGELDRVKAMLDRAMLDRVESLEDLLERCEGELRMWSLLYPAMTVPATTVLLEDIREALGPEVADA